METRRTYLLVLAVTALLPACNPYHNRDGEYYAGSVDPVNFNAAYQGTGYTKGSSFGTFTPAAANYKGGLLAYYSFPFVNGAVGVPLTASSIDVTGAPVNPMASFIAPLAYVFDPQPVTNPFPTKQKCVAPPNYTYDERTDGYRLDEQGNVFTDLPDDLKGYFGGKANYLPLVSEVVAQSNSEPCQGVKSAETIVSHTDVTLPGGLQQPVVASPNNFAVGKTDGNFLMWAVVDPSADVLLPDAVLGGNSHNPNTGLGPQRWGWFDHFLLAYLDGGYIPTNTHTVPGMMGMPDMTITEMVPQIMYVPNAVPDGMGGVTAGTPGMGFDVMQFQRGDAGYSPLCHVLFFAPVDPMNLPTSFDQVDMTTVQPDTGTFIACIQVK
jgi:hypothetical protein